jgi:hypothetical protein
MIKYIQFIKSTKCTQLFTYEYYIYVYVYRSDMFRRSEHNFQGARDAKFKISCQ